MDETLKNSSILDRNTFGERSLQTEGSIDSGDIVQVRNAGEQTEPMLESHDSTVMLAEQQSIIDEYLRSVEGSS
jgi:hypothetical protein